MDTQFLVQQVTWQVAAADMRSVRTTVFVEEQNVPPDLEWDGLDDTALHLLARDVAACAIGCARLLVHDDIAHIGRMAVLREWRGRGVGRALLAAVITAARDAGARSAFLNAQISAAGFYAQAGFLAQGSEFLDAGIPHIRMQRAL